MKIEELTVYQTNGKQFLTLKAAMDYREDLVEQFLRTVPGFQDIPASKKIAFVDAILQNRKTLAELLDF